MATNFSFFNRVVHFHFLSQKTCIRPTKAVLSYFVALLNTKAHPVSTSPTMATNLSFSNRAVHFHFLSQKTCTANPLLGHGMIKLPTPLRVTRIVVRASYRPHEKLQPERGLSIPPSGERVTSCEREIRNLLKKRDVPLDTVARDLSGILNNIGENSQLYDLCSWILKGKSEHISRMWEIAGCNHTDTATAILPREPCSIVKWRGFTSNDLSSVIFKGHREFPLKDEFKMKIERDSAHEYRVVFLGKKLLLFQDTLLEGYLYTDANAKYSHLAFKCGDRKHGDKHSSSLKEQTVLYIRIATPNVLVGQAKKTDCNADEKHETVLGEFVLVKD